MSGRPEKCTNCGFSQRHTRQLPGEVLKYCANCSFWLCAACRDQMCVPFDHRAEDAVMVNGSPQPTVPAEDGIYSRVSEDVYHGDPHSLSSSGARTLVNDCPAAFRAQQDEERVSKRHFDVGHLTHKMVLGEGQQFFVLDPAIHGRTKDGAIASVPAATAKWKAAAAEARAAGKTPVTKDDMDVAQRMAGVVHSNQIAAKLLSAGMAEMSGYWHDAESGVRLRFRPDFLPDLPGRMVCVDYKTAVSADPRKFIRSALDYGYHQQAAWYLDGLRECGVSDDAAFLFIVQSKTAPYLVSLVQLLPEHVELGRRQNRAAIDLFARCQESGVWPGYGDGIHMVGLPNWAVSQIESALADA